MFLTHDLLVSRHACGDGLKFFDAQFPHGAEMEQVLRAKGIQPSYIYWGSLTLGFDNDPEVAAREKAAYDEVLRLTNYDRVWRSYRIADSQMVSDSNHVEKSSHVFASSHITNSIDVCSSNTVENSAGVFNSKFVYDSTEVVFSTNVTRGDNIVNGLYVVDSRNILDSSMITNCSDITNGRNLRDSHFCSCVSDLTNCLFCYDINDKSNMLFNHQIDASMFSIIQFQYKSIMPAIRFTEPYRRNLVAQYVPSVTADIRKYYQLLMNDQRALDWIKNLPYFSHDLWYQITYCRMP